MTDTSVETPNQHEIICRMGHHLICRTTPGVGKMMVDAIKARNYPVVQGGVLMVALTFSLVNLAVDILYAFVDPRIRSQYK